MMKQYKAKTAVPGSRMKSQQVSIPFQLIPTEIWRWNKLN